MTATPRQQQAPTEATAGAPTETLDAATVRHARVLPLDVVQAKGSGHGGTAVSLTPALYILFQEYLRHDPSEPHWPGRDRFVLSAGHTSLSLYLQLYLSGYGLEMDDLRSARTLGSITPGHPEWGHTPGVETTTGPLGQGVGNSVGMAMAARRLQAILEPDTPADQRLFRHRVWCLASDGDLAEGISQEASSLAGTLRLSDLIVIWDDNEISIDGDTDIAFTEDTIERYRTLGWEVFTIEDAENPADIRAAFDAATAVTDRPVFIRLKTRIGHPMPTVGGTAAAHSGAPGEDEVRATKTALGLNPDASFVMPAELLDHARQVRDRGAQQRTEWQQRYQQWRTAHPERAELLDALTTRTLDDDALSAVADLRNNPRQAATRIAGAAVLDAVIPKTPWLWGGSADLSESNGVAVSGARSFLPEGTESDEWPGGPDGSLIHFGIREHAMGAILNGIALDGTSRPFGATFFTFADYMRPAVRLAALMQLPVVYVWTHDSVAVGEDGPTHQPVEHLWSYRTIPGLSVVRPADWVETVDAWTRILEAEAGPTALVLSRQGLPVIAAGTEPGDGARRGAYVISDPDGTIDALAIATGSEVSLALAAQQRLAADGIGLRVVSAPCLEWFEAEPAEWRNQVLPPHIHARVSVEAGTATGWHRYIGTWGEPVSVEDFGASGAGDLVMAERGMTVDNVVAAVRRSLERVAAGSGQQKQQEQR